MESAKVIEPENFEMPEQCDPGIVSCPACREMYLDFGGQIFECLKCSFQFPVDWWQEYSWGSGDGRRFHEQEFKLSAFTREKLEKHPYYAHGFRARPEHPSPDDEIDWQGIAGEYGKVWPVSVFFGYKRCKRCGEDKEPPRDSMTLLCIKCESETSCRHMRGAPMDMDCSCGVDLVSLVGDAPGAMLRSPCRYWDTAAPVVCDSFESTPEDVMHADDRAIEEAIARMAIAFPVVENVKAAHSGENWSGTAECPECGGVLHLSHAALNGHVWGRCEKEGCLAWME